LLQLRSRSSSSLATTAQREAARQLPSRACVVAEGRYFAGQQPFLGLFALSTEKLTQEIILKNCEGKGD